MWATTPHLKFTHPYPILRGNFCESSTGPHKNLRKRRWQPIASIYRKIYGNFYGVLAHFGFFMLTTKPLVRSGSLIWVYMSEDPFSYALLLTYVRQHGKRALMPYASSEGPDECAHSCTGLDILCLSTYTTVSINSVNGKRRPRSGPAFSANCKRALFVHCASY